MNASSSIPLVNGRADPVFAKALEKVSPENQAKAKAKAEDFEAVFLNSIISHMTSRLKCEDPFGYTKIFRALASMMVDQYARSFAKTGGIGIGNEVYRTLITQQANKTA